MTVFSKVIRYSPMPRAVDEDMTKVSSWVSGVIGNEWMSPKKWKWDKLRVTHAGRKMGWASKGFGSGLG